MSRTDTTTGGLPDPMPFCLINVKKTDIYTGSEVKSCPTVTPFRVNAKKWHHQPIIGRAGDQVCSHVNQRLPVKGSVMSCTQYIAYYRVSTVRQGTSGLGLDAQRAATAQFVMSSGGNLLSEYTEVESGKLKNRPKLDAAVEACRKTGATLLIAKLDRLARNVAFIANLLESGVKFVAVDMPNADRFMLHVYAAMAEEEGRRISERTKSALASAKLRGVELGRNGKALAQRHKREARVFALSMESTLRRLIEKEGASFSLAAERLNELAISTPRGGRWHSTSVYRVWKRINVDDCSQTYT